MSRHAAPDQLQVAPLLLPAGFVQDPAGGEPLPYGPRVDEWQRATAQAAAVDQPAEAGDVVEDQAAGLFAATDVQLPRGRWNPDPVVTINGQRMPNDAAGTGELFGQTVLDDLRVEWGTSEPLTQPEPSTAQLELIDFSRTWATRQDVIGWPVVLGYEYASGVTGDWAAGTFFRGRISDVDVSTVRVRRPDGTHQRAVKLALKCTSLETDLGNVRPSEALWPAEPITARVARVAGYCRRVASTVLARVSDWGTAQAAANDQVSSSSIRDLLVQLYNSTGGDRLVYRPALPASSGLPTGLGVYENLGRRVSSARTMARLYYGGATHPRVGQGAWVGPTDRGRLTYQTQADVTTPLYLDAAVLQYDDGLSRNMASRITRVAVTSKDSAAADAARTSTRIAPGLDEGVLGQRALTLDSLHNWNAWADLNAEDLLAMATQEGSQWRPGRLRWDVKRSGGFELVAQGYALLLGHMSGYQFFLSRSELAELGVRPVVSVIGGVIAYRRGGWVLDLDVAGWASYGGGNSSPTRVPQHSATWEELAGDGTSTFGVLSWGTGDTPGATNFHASVTYEDLRHVGQGINGPIGPDQGWDQ